MAYHQPLLKIPQTSPEASQSKNIRSERSSTSALFGEYKAPQLSLNTYHTYHANAIAKYTYSDSPDGAPDTIDIRMQKRGCSMWIILCICCPCYLFWYLGTTCIKPRCYVVFTMSISIIWILMDEITDILFLVLIYVYSTSSLVYPYLYIFVACVSFNHVCNLMISVIIRQNWSIGPHKNRNTIPQHIQWFWLMFVGVMDCATFNTICKTYYLSQNMHNVASIYMEQRLTCCGNNAHGNRNYNKLYDMEALDTKQMFNEMLEREARVYPLLVMVQLSESITKIIVFAEMSVLYPHENVVYPYIYAKLIMAIVAVVFEMQSCYVSCANAEFIDKFTNH
eukprot:481308_1